MVYTTSAAVVVAGADGILVQVNAALTGTLTCSAATGGTFAVITNPTVGTSYRYGGLRGGGAITVTPSTTCDATVTVLGPGRV